MAVVDATISATDWRSALAKLIPSGSDSGKLVIIGFETSWLAGDLASGVSSSWPYPAFKAAATNRIFVSTDASLTEWEMRGCLPHATPNTGRNDCAECPIVFLPNGDWMTACYTRETHDFISWYSASYFRSTDNGHTWTHEGFISRANTSNSDQHTAYQADEPQLLMLANGEMLCVIRTLEEGRNEALNGYTHHLWRCANPTARGAMTWTDEGVCTVSQAASRPALFQHSNGMILHGFRVITSGSSRQGAWRVSNDNGHTWTAERNLDDGTPTSGDSGTGIYSYGAWEQLSNGGLIHIYANDTGGLSYTREARLAATTDVSITVTANSVWSQTGTTITAAKAPRGTRTRATATVSSPGGGIVQFRGTHADRFSVSLDGTTWAPAVTVPAGTTTIYLGVTPQAGDTTLSAQVGVPA